MNSAMAVPSPMIKPPTQTEIMQLLRERMPGLAIYNPSDQWLRPQVHGIERHFPPDLNGAVVPNPMTGEPTTCDGRYTVKGRFLTQKDASGKTIEGQDAQSVVAFLIHRERMGEMGVVWLPGRDKDEDEALMAQGRDRWLKYQKLADERVISRRREFKNNWGRNPAHKGSACPPPTPVENAATERMQEREHARQYGFECDVDDCPGYATDEWAKYALHMAAAHRVTAKRTVKGIVTLTNEAGDTVTLQPMTGTGGKTRPVMTEAQVEAAAEAHGTSAEDVHPALKGVSKAAKKTGKKKGG